MTTEISTQTQARGLALQSFDDAFRFSKMVASSDFAPKDFKGKPESCLLAIQHGSEVGLSPMQSLQSIAVINGRPTIWGDAALALVQASPVCEYVREYTEGDGDNLTAVCEAKRKGYPAPTISRFSMADAKRAGLAGKAGPWSQYPGRMLALRARGFALRNAFADALRGLITAEEAQDYPPADATTMRQQEPTQAVVRGGYTAKATAEGAVVAHKPPTAEQTPEQRCRLAINRATTLDELDAIRRGIETRKNDGTFDEKVAGTLIDLTIGQAERLGIVEEAQA